MIIYQLSEILIFKNSMGSLLSNHNQLDLLLIYFLLVEKKKYIIFRTFSPSSEMRLSKLMIFSY